MHVNSIIVRNNSVDVHIKLIIDLIYWIYVRIKVIQLFVAKINFDLHDDLIISLIQLKIFLIIYNAFVYGINARISSINESNKSFKESIN